MHSRSDNSEALAAFLAHKAEIDGILERLAAFSAEHFNVHPDEVNWGHVGRLRTTWAESGGSEKRRANRERGGCQRPERVRSFICERRRTAGAEQRLLSAENVGRS